jgi:hypothetical protein
MPYPGLSTTASINSNPKILDFNVKAFMLSGTPFKHNLHMDLNIISPS